MERTDQILLIVAAGGALAAVGLGVLAGQGFRVPFTPDPADRQVIVGTETVFEGGAPAYPTWAPEPLYPEAERDPLDEFSDAWDTAMADRAAPPVVLGPPPDLPPPYEVRVEGEPPLRAEPSARQPQPAPEGERRYTYRGLEPRPQSAAQDDKPKA